MPRRHDANQPELRALIASTAARLLAEDGINDYTLAKRKALRQLGLPDNTQLPENGEVEVELRTFQRLFQDEEQNARIYHLRQKASEIMSLTERFTPYLTGSVLDGSAGRYAEIDIQLYADSAKDVEIFLLNENIPFAHSVPRTDRAEAVLTVDLDDAVANLIVYPPHEERVTLRTSDGRVRRRARLDAVRDLLLTTRPDAA